MATVSNEVSGYRGGVINAADAFLFAKMGSMLKQPLNYLKSLL